MKTVCLHLVHSRDREFQADAWFVPGADTRGWLAELMRWKVDMSSLRLRVVPDRASDGSTAHQTILGVLVTGESTRPEISIAQPYRLVNGNLFVPLESRITPSTSANELAELLDRASIVDYVWHPISGLIGYSADEVLTVDRLLAVDPPHDADWSRTSAGTQLSSRLVAIEAIVSISIPDMFEDARGDIGSQSDLTDIPQSPDESPTGVLHNMGDMLKRPFAQVAKWFTDRVPATASQRSWIDSMNDWAKAVLNKSINQTRRMNELKRLMHLLDSDPDQGLKYAIPFADGAAHRGLGTPTDRLVPHEVDYRAGGSGSADFWDMPIEIRIRLTQQYRDLAQRETRLGRYRRAAYIYAQLLGDDTTAARTLEQGHYFREAAAIYQKRLGQPRKAAECLRDAGLWSEAISLFEKIENWEEAAKIYEQVGETESANREWIKAIDTSRAEGNYLRAADLYEQRLQNPMAAADCLEVGWNTSADPEACLTKLFQVMGRNEDHDGTRQRIENLCLNPALPANRQVVSARILADLTHDYPNGRIRQFAADATRRLVSRNIETRQPDSSNLLAALQRLSPDDRLLTRDCDRYSRRHIPQGPAPSLRRGDVQSHATAQLDPSVEWITSVSDGRRLYVAGYQRHHRHESLVIALWTPDRPDDSPEYTRWYISAAERPRLELLMCAEQQRPLMIHMFGDHGGKDFSRKTSFIGQQVRNSPAATAFVIALAAGAAGTTWVLALDRAQDNVGLFPAVTAVFFLCAYGADGIPRENFRFTVGLKNMTALMQAMKQASMVCIGSKVCCAIDRKRLLLDVSASSGSDGAVRAFESMNSDSSRYSEWDLPQPAFGMSRSARAKDPRVAISFEEGGLVHWLNTAEQHGFGHGLYKPITRFTPQGDLIVVGEHGEIEIYRTVNNSMQRFGAFSGVDIRPIGIMTSHANLFCIVHEDGTIESLRLKR